MNLSSARMMTLVVAAATLPATATGATADDYGEAWQQLKMLSGTWDSYVVGKAERRSTISYHVTGGEAVVFEEFLGKTPDGVRAMATAYHLDGDGLVATHYCGAANQPRMRATSYDPVEKVLHFDFWDVTNLQNPDAYHTTNIELWFESDDAIELRFRGIEDGKQRDWRVHRLRRLTTRPHQRGETRGHRELSEVSPGIGADAR